MLYVETDGRHVSALTRAGKVLWTRNPFSDAHLQPYRVQRPRIVQLATISACHMKLRTLPQLKNHTVFLGFDSSQFGSLDPLTGDFFFEGQN